MCWLQLGGKKRSLHRFLKSLIKGWQIFHSSCVVLKQTAGLLFPRPPPLLRFFCSLLSHLLSSLITEGAAGGLCSSLGLLLLASFIAVAPGETPLPNRKRKQTSCKKQKTATVCISFIPTVGARGHEWVTPISWWHQRMIQKPEVKPETGKRRKG